MRFDIELLGFDGEAPVDELARAFEIDRDAARSIACRTPVFVKRDVDEKTAEGYFHALRELGGRVKLHKRATLPPPRSSVPPPIMPPPSRPLEIELDADMAPAVALTPRSTPPPRMMESAAIPDLAIELEDVSGAPSLRHPSSRPPASPSYPPLAAVAPVSRTSPPVDREIEDKGGYLEAVAGAYLYPFQKTALPSLIMVPVVTQFFSYAPFLIGVLLSNGIWITYLFAVTQHASLGHKDLPLSPDYDSWIDMIGPVVRYLLAFIVPGALIFGLFILLTGGLASADEAMTGGELTLASVPVLVFVAVGAWLLYLPASLILAAHSRGCLGGLNLIAGVKLIVREPFGYAITLAGIAPAAVVMVVLSVVSKIADQMIPIPFLPGVIGLLLTFIPSLVIARILGLYLWHHEEELGIG
jgi:hypothetical protein